MSDGQSMHWDGSELPRWAVGYVYLFATSDRFSKIGFSQNPESRVKAFRRLPFAVWLEHAFPVGDQLVETVVHKALESKRVRYEWFILSADDVTAFKQVRSAPTWYDLPDRFRAVGINRTNTGLGGRRPRPWYRAGRGWFVNFRGRRYNLGVRDPNAAEEAQEAFERLRRESNRANLAQDGTA